MSADDLRGRLDRAAEDVVPPGDAVGRVRARVEQRRRRRTGLRVAAASAGAVAVLVAGVVVAPDRLDRDAAPPAGVPSAPVEGVGPLLSPDGLPGLALGDPAPEVDGILRGGSSGCDGADGSLLPDDLREAVTGSATELTSWSRDGVVVSLTMALYPDRVQLPGDVPRTWLGPTLRDPVARALELEGARLVSEDPLGDTGPAISSVVVPVDGGEIVFADPPTAGRPSEGRITTITLRTRDGRGCHLVPGEDVRQPGQAVAGEPPVALTAEGTRTVRLGGSVTQALEEGLLETVGFDFGDPLDGRGCTMFRAAADGADVWADGDRVVAVAAFGLPFTLRAEVDVESGRPESEALALPGAGPADAPVTQTGAAVDLPVAPGVRARVVSGPEAVLLEEAEVLVEGLPLVDGVLVYPGDEPADSLC